MSRRSAPLGRQLSPPEAPSVPTGIADLLTAPRGRRIIGHRGAAAAAPENTRASFEAAIVAGVDAIELDVRVTMDGVPIVLHDPSTDRTTDQDFRIDATTFATLSEADAGYRFSRDGGASYPFRGLGLRIPTLEVVLDRYRTTPLLLDIKSARGVEAVRRVLDRHAAAARVVVASTYAAALPAFRNGGYRLGASRRDVARLLARVTVGLLPRRLPFHLMSIPPRYGLLSLTGHRMVEATARLGIAMHVWTIDDPTTATRLWAAGVTGVITNDPGVLVAQRGPSS